LAKFLTSSATTANPAPASPARAASTAAFRASKLVWKAISSMVLMIFPVSSLLLLISRMASAISCICPLTLETTSSASAIRDLAAATFSPLSLVMPDIVSIEAHVSAMLADCSVAPSARQWLAEAR